MNKSFFIIFFSILSIQNGLAQFHIVYDSIDKYVNVRGENNKIIDQVPIGTIVWEAMPDFEWSYDYNSIYAVYFKEDRGYAGNIHQSRLINIRDSFKQLDKTIREDNLYFKTDSVAVSIKTGQINKSIINSNVFESINFKTGNKLSSLPSDSYTDLIMPNPEATEVYYDKFNQRFFIITNGGDGAEGYGIMWVIEKNVYQDRYICCIIPDEFVESSLIGIKKEDIYKYIIEKK